MRISDWSSDVCSSDLAEKEVKIIVWAKERYARGLPKAMARPWATIGIGVGVFALSAVAFQFIGSEFIPRLDERNLAISALRIPSTSIEQSLDMQRKVERVISSFPQVQ